MSAGIDFDAEGVTKIDIIPCPTGSTDDWKDDDWKRWNERATDVLERLAKVLHLEAVSTEMQDQRWTVDGVRVDVLIDTGPGDFMLVIHRPSA